MTDFAHLRVHSTYTLSEGASKVDTLVAEAKKLGIPAIALADRNNLFSALDFSKTASSSGIQPIIACQLSLEYAEGKYGAITLLAQSELGYRNLCALLRSATDPRPNKKGELVAPEYPSIQMETLEKLAADIILLTGGGQEGLLPKLALKQYDLSTKIYRNLLGTFGDRLYVEISRVAAPTNEEAEIEDILISLANGAADEVECNDGVVRSEAPLVATSEIWYATEDRHDAWLLLKAIESKTTITIDGDAIVEDASAKGLRYHMRSAEEMRELFADLPEAYENAGHIARRCAFMVKGRKPILPPFPCDGGRTESDELREQSRIGLVARLEKAGITGEAKKPYEDRLEYELSVIDKMGFPGYFLIVSDFIKWAKSNDIPVGPGRGSGAGSVVAWALTITDLDPLEFGLLFERFLNPERVSMPDFDIDFCEDRRTEVIEYVRQRYGSDRVAMIATFGGIGSKTALTDMQRIIVHNQFGTIYFGDVKDLTKLIPKKEEAAEPMGLKEAYDKVPEFRQKVDGSEKLTVAFQQALKVEGLYRSVGSHAAGIVISDRPLEDLVPVSWDGDKSIPVAGFNMKGIEAAGLVKFDFLGLTTLSVIREALRHIEEFHGIKVDISAINRHEPMVYDQFAKGLTTGVFQFESGGMRNVLRQVKPTRLEDLIAVNALFRPGPMDYIPLYANRKNGAIKTEYPQPEERTKPFLEETYGIMVYQEQVMQVAQASAGYSLGGADLLRRAMGKKIVAEMDAQRKIFIYGDEKSGTPGAVKLGMDAKVADKLFDDIAKFAGYGFNKSHAAAYAWIAYQTMWLKVHYPAEFFSALMTYNKDNPDKLALIKDELDVLKVKLLPPDVNHSHGRFKPEVSEGSTGGLAVRFGFQGIKGLSGNSSDLSGEREKNGAYKSLEEFHRRVGGRFNKAQMQRLAEAGAFKDISANRKQAASVLTWLASKKDTAPAGQTDMFGGIAAVSVPKSVSDVTEWNDLAEREFKAVGFYFSSHPIDGYQNRLYVSGVRRRLSFQARMVQTNVANMEGRRLCVMVDDIKLAQTSKGATYLQVYVSEKNDSYRISCYEHWNSEFKIQDFRKVLEGAKADRTPVVFLASLTYDADKDTTWVNGKAVWKVDEFLNGVRGDFTIKMGPVNLRNGAEVNSKIAQLERDIESGKISESVGESYISTLIQGVVEKEADDLSVILQKNLRDDNNEEAIGIVIETPNRRIELPGKYNIDRQSFGVIATRPGVASVSEIFARTPEDLTPSSPPEDISPRRAA